MSRLPALLLLVLVLAGLVVVGEHPPAGEAGGRPPHLGGPTPKRGPFAVEGAAGRDGAASGPSRPRRLVIGSLGIRAAVVPVEIAGRTLYPPDDVAKVGWWRDGAMPGAPGSTVVTGHTVSGGDGVFDALARLRIGDPVRLATEDGVLRYVVTFEASYGRAALAHRAPQLFRQSGASRLVLVTCEDWDGEVYRANHVVIATPA